MRRHVRPLGAAVVLAAVILVAGFFFRAWQTGEADDQLCSALRTIILEIRDTNPDEAETYNRWLAFLPDCPRIKNGP